MRMLTREPQAEIETAPATSSTLESLSVFGVSYRTAHLELRSHLNFAGERAFELLQALSSAGVGRSLVLSTCNRTEIYFSGSCADAVLNVVATESGLSRAQLKSHSYTYSGARAANHLFRVACGLESAALGETEILSQLKQALKASGQVGRLSGPLNLLFRRALEVSKRVRTETALCKNVTSVASMAIRQASVISGGLRDKNILLIGAGEIAERLAKEISKASGRQCTVVNRTFSRAEALASEYGFAVAKLAHLPALLDAHDVVFCAVNSDKPLIKPAMVAGRQMTFVDLGVPSVIEDLSECPGCQVVDMEFLSSACSANSDLRSQAVHEAEAIIDKALDSFAIECAERDVAPAIEALGRLGEKVREDNVAWALSRLGDISPNQTKVIEDMAMRLVRGMLQGQIAAMKSESLSPQERACLASVFEDVGAGTARD